MAELKKFKVKTINGEFHIIEAKNIHDATTIARSSFGQLPNDINNKIVSAMRKNIVDTMKELTTLFEESENAKKENNWNIVYKNAQEINKKLDACQKINDGLAGSMLKIDKGADNE